ncbi:MAG: GNAT family N-acetyltransferase [Clostridia bacterium]|nr:GNAT family N-acetyltransferase [Clostridia bacterium]
MDFIQSIQYDDRYCDPMLLTKEQFERNLEQAVGRPGYDAFVTLNHGNPTGLFVFLALPKEHYLEMLAGISRLSAAYGEMLKYIATRYLGYNADFIFNPKNDLLREQLVALRAQFEPEQQKLIFSQHIPEIMIDGIEPLASKYYHEYLAIHRVDTYWTGEKVAHAPDRFRVLLALDEEKVVGYLDVTYHLNENEPYDLFVLPEYLRKGHGRRLLAKALQLNEPYTMHARIDIDNLPALRLFESLGFRRVNRQNSIAARCVLKSSFQKSPD